jgi:hypothetical protein
MIHEGECGAVGGMRIGRGNRSTEIKSAPVPLWPPQIAHNLTWAGTRAHSGKPAINCLCYGTAFIYQLVSIQASYGFGKLIRKGSDGGVFKNRLWKMLFATNSAEIMGVGGGGGSDL